MFNREKAGTVGPRCSKCGAVYGAEKVCSCGKATPNMSFDERTQYEVQQYKAYKSRTIASV